MNDLTIALIGLFGVMLGSIISYYAQMNNQKRIKKRDDRRQKHIAYNLFLYHDGEKSPSNKPYPHGAAEEFDSELYREEIRGILYQNLHLFSEEIVKNV